MSRTSKLFIRCLRLRRVLSSLPSHPIEECKRPRVHRPFLPSEYLDLMNLYLSFSCRIICMIFSYLFVFISQSLCRDHLSRTGQMTVHKAYRQINNQKKTQNLISKGVNCNVKFLDDVKLIEGDLAEKCNVFQPNLSI